MFQRLCHDFKLWTIGIILIGLLLIAAQCSPTATPITQGTPTEDRPPEIIGFTHDPSGPVSPDAEIKIQVNVNGHGHKIDNYRWVVVIGSIVSGEGTSLITYEAPKTPGIYEVRVALEYKGGPPVEGSTKVEVVTEPTPPPTEVPTAGPTQEPTGEPTKEPTEEPTAEPTEEPTLEPAEEPTAELTEEPIEEPTDMPHAVVKAEALNLRSGPSEAYDVLGEELKQGVPLTVTGTCPAGDWLKVICPGRQEGWAACSLLQINVDTDGVRVVEFPLLPPPTLISPKDSDTVDQNTPLEWAWDGQLGPGECSFAQSDQKWGDCFSLRVTREGEKEPCFHVQLRETRHIGNLAPCRSGYHFWGVGVAHKATKDSGE